MKRLKWIATLLVVANLLLGVIGCKDPEPAHEHEFSDSWSKDGTYHWHAATCEHTTEVSGKAAHSFGEYVSNNDATTEADGTKTRECSVCGYKDTVTDEGSKIHVHIFAEEWTSDSSGHWHAATCEDTDETSGFAEHTFGEYVSNNDATTEADGTKTRECSVCGYKDTVTDEGSKIHVHTFAEEWTSDSSGHWHEATCEDTTEVSGKAAHTFGEYVSNNDATTDADGTKTRECSVCGYKDTVTDEGSKIIVPEFVAEAISVNSTNHKTTYDVGDYLDVSGLTIEVTKEDGTTKTVYVTESMVDGFYSYTAGTQTLTITYGGCTTTFDVTVVANVSLTGIEIVSEPDKTSYIVGEDLDLSGLEIEATYSDGSTSYVDVSLDMVSGFDSSVARTQTLTVTYGDCTATFDVEVVENSVSSLNITSTPSKTSYYVGEDLDLSGLEIEAVYSNGSTSYVDVSLDMVSGFNSSKVGTQTVTITYRGYTATFTVEVEYHTITFNANGGSGTMTPRTVEETSYYVGETPYYYFNIASDFTAPTGYGFSHWNTKADGSGTTYELDDYYPISEDITLYAQWKKVESNLNVELPGSTEFSISQTVDGDNVKFKCSYSYYNSYAWFIDGVKQTSTSSEMTVDTSTMDAGSYTVMLTVKYDGKYWSENATLTIKK